MKNRVVELRDQISVTDTASISAEDLDKQLKTFLDACPGDTLVLIDQPGVSSEDFKASMATSALWTQFGRYFSRCATVLPYLQTPVQLDMDAIAQHYVERCGAEVIEPDLGRQNVEKRLFGHYVDTKRRVIKVRFPALLTMDNDDDVWGRRRDELFENDKVLHDIITGTPSPLFSIIYTNSDGANTTKTPAGTYTDYHMIHELVQRSRDPSNRDLWKKHAPLEPGQYLGHLGDVKPPLAQLKRSQAKQAAAEAAAARKEERLAQGYFVDILVHNINQWLTVSSVLVCAGFLGSGLVILGMVRLVLRLLFSGSGSGSETKAATKAKTTETDQKTQDDAPNAEFHASAYEPGDVSVSSGSSEGSSRVSTGSTVADEPEEQSKGLRRRKV